MKSGRAGRADVSAQTLQFLALVTLAATPELAIYNRGCKDKIEYLYDHQFNLDGLSLALGP